ncbi:MAG: prolipoprotein diacylglyceryl transferase family protein, partial [Betaproteobacteria bacterium]
MIHYPHINPEIVRIGPVAVRWYGLMYAVGFASSYLLVRYQIQKLGQRAKGPDRRREEVGTGLPAAFLDSLYTYLVLGLIIGA